MKNIDGGDTALTRQGWKYNTTKINLQSKLDAMDAAITNLAYLPIALPKRLPIATCSRQNADAILKNVEAMLIASYSRAQSPDEWWLVFSSYYQELQIDADARNVLNSRLDWLFCHHGETGWPGVRMTLPPMNQAHAETPALQGTRQDSLRLMHRLSERC